MFFMCTYSFLSFPFLLYPLGMTWEGTSYRQMSQENHDPAEPERRLTDEETKFHWLEQLHEIRKNMIETAETILQYVLKILLHLPQVLSCLGLVCDCLGGAPSLTLKLRSSSRPAAICPAVTVKVCKTLIPKHSRITITVSEMLSSLFVLHVHADWIPSTSIMVPKNPNCCSSKNSRNCGGIIRITLGIKPCMKAVLNNSPRC